MRPPAVLLFHTTGAVHKDLDMSDRVRAALEACYREAVSRGFFPETPIPSSHQIVPSKQTEHGDFASNLALILAPVLKRPPRSIAETLKDLLTNDPLFERVDVAGPGFINFFVSRDAWTHQAASIHAQGDQYGESQEGKGKRVLVEFVSANPTGPLHVGHGRGAAVGDSLARILKAAGYRVETEYYINDVGNQMRTLGSSVYLRYQEILGRTIEFPPDYYQGDYIRDIANKILVEQGERYRDVPLEECLPDFTSEAVREISRGIRKDLEDFDVSFDSWFSEARLHEEGIVERTIRELRDAGHIYEQDGALWFRTTAFGDEKDRVVRRSNGVLTYFAADMAYHRHKLERGYDTLVDIWGADHHGYVPRISAVVQALGHDSSRLRVLLVQFVSLIEGGVAKGMSTRSGEFVTLRAVLDDVGPDAARFFFLMRKADSHLDFDLDLARKQGQENPVYYVQYAHARLASVARNAQEAGYLPLAPENVDTSRLSGADDIALIKLLDAFPRTVAESARAMEPHRVSFYLTELASFFHGYYTRNRFIGDDPDLTRARLLLAEATRRVIRKGLGLLGVSAPTHM